MINIRIKEIHFDFINDGATLPRLSMDCNGDLRCRINCFEWSDGRLGCPHKRVSVVQRSRKTGKFIWYTDYIAEGIEMGQSDNAKNYDLHDLQEAFDQLKYIDQLGDKHSLALFLEIIHAYNDEYHRNPLVEKKIPIPDYKLFVECVLEAQKVGKDRLPASMKAELYREAGMFEKCFEFSTTDGRSRDEKEIIGEVLFRAAHGDTKPFIIEQCEYFKRNPRLIKRTPCPMAEC